jgi:hypothetical protein
MQRINKGLLKVDKKKSKVKIKTMISLNNYSKNKSKYSTNE